MVGPVGPIFRLSSVFQLVGKRLIHKRDTGASAQEVFLQVGMIG
jgi:hypothetical protein